MVTVEVFDPPMCCSTGVCGPSVDPALAQFAADLQWAGERGVSVRRYNLAQEPGPFAGHEEVRTLLTEGGEDALPVVVVDGEVRSSGRYPAREELAAWTLPAGAGQTLDEVTAELVAIGAAVGANCEPCFKYHYSQARKAGVSTDVIAAAVRLAQTVKDTPARSMLDLAARLLGTSAQVLQTTPSGAEQRGAGQQAPAVTAGEAGAAEGTTGAADDSCCGTPAQTLPLTELAQESSPCCGGSAEAADSSPAAAVAGSGGCCG